MVKSATKPITDYQRFIACHRHGYNDAIEGKSKAQYFACLICERGYLAGWAMAQLTQESHGYTNQGEYWRVWTKGVEDVCRSQPYENPYPLKNWKHLAYLSGVRSRHYCSPN